MIGPRRGDEEAIRRAEQARYLATRLAELRAAVRNLPARVGEEVAIKDHLCGLLNAFALLVTPGRGEHLPARTLDRITAATGHLDALVSLFTGRHAPRPASPTSRPAPAPGPGTTPTSVIPIPRPAPSPPSTAPGPW